MAGGVLNPFVIKRWVVSIGLPTVSVIGYVIGSAFYGVMGGIGFFIGGLLISFLLAKVLLNNPFTGMLEGQGLLAINLDSTGILQPFLVKVSPPYIKGKVWGKPIEDAFDRSAVHMLAAPKKAGSPAQGHEDGSITYTLTEKELNSSRFALFHWPVILWNSQIHSFITKEWLSEQENVTFAEHAILYLNRKVEELSTDTKNFARYVVDQLKPAGKLFSGNWIWILIIGGILLLLLIIGWPMIQNFMGSAGNAASSAAGAVGGTANLGGGPINVR